MADGKGCVCNAYSSTACACDADWTPQEIYDLRAVVVASMEAITVAMPYIAPLAQKNSHKGDGAMAALSYLARAMEMAKKLPHATSKGPGGTNG